ncbi:MAG: SLC13 family permease [Thermovenabulum sp.]|uniref:SLC13 family permease n=1 Tax=Thermovenabulum sp. TaxID=3100335 RepID=UPI003C7A2B42
MIKKFADKAKEDVVLLISFFLAVFTSFLSTPKIEYIDFKVLISLFNLMIVIEAFEDLKLLEMLAINILDKFNNEQRVTLALVLLTFLFSMFITNDVALITLVPLALIIAQKTKINPAEIIVFQTLAANIGSSLTPIGNPQNLFLFSKYKIGIIEFFKIMSPFVLLGLVVLYLLVLKIPREIINFHIEQVEVKDKTKAVIFSLLFILIILSIFNVINYYIAFVITIIVTFIINKKIFIQVDYALLLTFAFFFIFIGNLSSLDSIKAYFIKLLSRPKTTFISSVILSQLISNVPCAILLSGFTKNYRELLLGVNIGGMGTLIASLASVISFKFYVNEYKGYKKDYLIKFTVYNLFLLTLFSILFGVLI